MQLLLLESAAGNIPRFAMRDHMVKRFMAKRQTNSLANNRASLPSACVSQPAEATKYGCLAQGKRPRKKTRKEKEAGSRSILV
jgi:hypothetical protein